MPDHHLAFADIMADLLSQSPDKPSDPPVVKSDAVLEDKTNEVLKALIGESSAAHAVATESAKPAPVRGEVPQVVVQEAASTPTSGFHAAVARFKAMKNGGS